MVSPRMPSLEFCIQRFDVRDALTVIGTIDVWLKQSKAGEAPEVEASKQPDVKKAAGM